jgi:photosystem II stability/assembly factor-like uncharacterized protein
MEKIAAFNLNNMYYNYFLLLLTVLFGCNNPDDIILKTSSAPTRTISNSSKNILYQSDDLGLNWKAIPSNLPTAVQSFIIKPFGKQLLLSTENQGLYLSDQEKTAWQRIGHMLPNPKINAIDIKGNTIVVSVFQSGVYLSTNGGQLWQSLNQGLTDLNVMCVLFDEESLLVGTDSGIFKFDLVDNIWQKVFEHNQIVSLNKANGKIIAGSTGGILMSEDNGINWNWIHQKGAIHNTAILNDRIFGMYISNDLYVSDDWGKNWTLAAYNPKEGSYIYDVTYKDPYYFACNNHGIHRSADHGKTWEFIHPKKEFLFFDFAVDGDIIFASTRDF